jgi:hypothetical protein
MSVVLAALAAAILGGCQGKSGDLKPQAKPVIADVPWPEGFSYDDSRSRSFTAAGTRYIDHLYKGRQDKYEALLFYKRYMPANQWTQVREANLQGDVLLDFDKGNERCSITITNGNLFYTTYIHVVLSIVGKVETPQPPR